MDLQNKVVFITGGSRGIGAEVARQCGAKGAKVFLAGLEPAELRHVCDSIGADRAAWLETDVTDLEAVGQAVAAAVERFGEIDCVLANAGVAPYGTVATVGHATFERAIDINLGGVWNTLNATLPALTASRGHVLTVCSVASFAPLGGLHAYTASKAAAESLTSAFSMEVAHLGITVGSVHPSWIDTDMVRNADSDLPTFARMRKLLPWPIHATTDVAQCGAAIVRGFERRKARVYCPPSAALVYWIRPLLQSPTTLKLMQRVLGRLTPELEGEIRALGRTLNAREAEHQHEAEHLGAAQR
jgi:NAD(P)-dependent dehydrogenase (short-subunit alcohol dehydrogenase family)